MLMQEYHFNLLRNIDIILITLTALLSVIIIIYASIDERYMRKRYNKLTNIISDLQKLEFQGNDAIVSDCSILIKKTTPFELFHILKHQENIQPGKFSEQFTECLNNSGKISAIEKIAENSRNKWRRIEAIIILGYFKSPNTIQILKQTLSNKDSDIVYFSLISLGHIKNLESAEILLSAIKNRIFSSFKIAAILEHFPPDIVEILINNLTDQDQNLRLWSIKIISRFKPKQYAHKISVLTDDTSPDIRAAACECLGEIAEESTKEAVKKCLKDRIWYVRLHATRALENILGPKSIADIAPLLKDIHWFVRENVKDIMIKHFSEAIIFINKFLNENDQSVKQSCIEIMDISGYRDKVLENIVKGDSETIKKAQLQLETMIKAGAHHGLEGILSKYSDNTRERILSIISAIDKGKADHIAKKLKGKIKEI
ncbi:MAG: hypothetical protein A2539_10565 [Elusimicrobia bacterium RIFOXYD2_FULL_34_15]|nr:MAG: hypothetical protein A2539_10565 [Elusimicrobia bacterium RIFOXYD2_FULL_34_15]